MRKPEHAIGEHAHARAGVETNGMSRSQSQRETAAFCRRELPADVDVVPGPQRARRGGRDQPRPGRVLYDLDPRGADRTGRRRGLTRGVPECEARRDADRSHQPGCPVASASPDVMTEFRSPVFASGRRDPCRAIRRRGRPPPGRSQERFDPIERFFRQRFAPSVSRTHRGMRRARASTRTRSPWASGPDARRSPSPKTRRCHFHSSASA